MTDLPPDFVFPPAFLAMRADLRCAFDAVASFQLGPGQVRISREGDRWTVGSPRDNKVAEAAGRIVPDPPKDHRSKAHTAATRFDFRKAVLVARRVAACYADSGIDLRILEALDRVAWIFDPSAPPPPPTEAAAQAKTGSG